MTTKYDWLEELMTNIAIDCTNTTLQERQAVVEKSKSSIISHIEQQQRDILEDLDNLLTEADHSQNGEWTSWEVESYVSVLRNLIKERMK